MESADELGSEWDAYVGACPDASGWHYSAWLEVIERAFGHECRRWVARDEYGRIRGVLPMVRLRSRLFGDFGVSLPFVNYGGALADDADTRTALMQAASEYARQAGMRHIEFRDREALGAAWPVRTDKVIMSRSLPEDSETLWQELTTKQRTRVRRAQKHDGITVERGRLELLDDFYAVFARNMRDLGTPVYGPALFRAVLERFPHAFIVVVRHRERPVAAGFLFGHRDRLEIPWASALRDYNAWGVNMLLYWRCLESATEQGYLEFDFGRSTVDSGTYRFKQQWGAEPSPCYWHYWLAPGRDMPGLTPDNPRFRLAIGAWQRLPLAIANRFGPAIVKNLP
ncbi:MAG: FemAB family XrtA/PEP-CTERM system-associated protein [Halofilum sp. (in: g-proteobacteria)]